MIDPVVSVSLRCLLALLFASAAWHKASNPSRFASTLEGYRLLPSWLATAVTRVLPVLEITVAVVLLLPLHRWYAWAGLGAAALLVLYSVAILINLARGRRDIDCGCFGPTARVPLSGALIVRNSLLIVAATVVSLPLRVRSLLWMDAFTVVVVVAAATLLWSSFWLLRKSPRTMGGTR